jgi:hypothetical protein
MQPADVRVDPWVWVPFSRRRGRVLPTVLVATVAGIAGYMMGRHSDKTYVAPPEKTVAASPITQPVAVNSKAKPREAEKPDLALKSESDTPKHVPALTQPKPEAPSVVVLNPGTADPTETMADRATARASKSAPPRAVGDAAPHSDVVNSKPREARAAGSQSSMSDYQSLRDYMLGR